jgi:Ca-activated chloride channel family protein
VTQLNAIVALALVATALPGSTGESPAEVEVPLSDRLSWNARERTATGLSALEKGDGEAATRSLDTALRLRPDDAVARFNAGTVRIESESTEAAALLREAAKIASPDLAPEAWYNAGNAHLAAGQPGPAIEAFIESLRRRPDHAAAKFNLEVARREEERQKQQDSSREDGDRRQEGDEGQQPQSAGSGERESESDAPGDQRGEAGPKQDPAGREGDRAGSATGTNQPASPLPRFRDLADMTAEQAAAILQAVDNLERRQRRQRAIEAAGTRSTTEIDW